MALVTCSRCGSEVSDRAPACPRCGNAVLGQSTDVAASAAPPPPAAAPPPRPAPRVTPASRADTQLPLGELGGLTRALSAATDVQKLAVTVVGFVATLALIKFITQIAALGGTGTTSRPGSSGFGGFGGTPSNVGDAILGSLLAGLLAAVIWWVGSSLTLGTVARMCVAELSDGRPIPWRSAVGYAARHIDGFLLGPLVFGLLCCS
jgi:hypothetical protein